MTTMAALDGLSRRERLDWLAGQLRRPLPADFDWYFPESTHCAIGLYEKLTARKATPMEFGLSKRQFDRIFYKNPSILVQPDDVARRIEQTPPRRSLLEYLFGGFKNPLTLAPAP